MATEKLPTLTFEEFRATRVFCADLGDKLSDEMLEKQHGFLYLDALYIEIVDVNWLLETQKKGAFSLTIGNFTALSDDLETFERQLYEYACGEYCEAPEPDANRFKLSEDVLEEALNAAVLVVQRHIGQIDGGLASIYFSGEGREGFDAEMQSYADHEKIVSGEN